MVKLAGCLLVAGCALAAVGQEPVRLGMLYAEDPEQPGVLETVGRSFHSGEVLKALSHGALLRLDNGRVLKLAPNSSALFEARPDGEVGVRVLSGRVSLVGDAGRTLVAGQRSTFTLSPTLSDPEDAERRLLELETGPPGHRDVRSRRGRPQAGR
jgi:hypothetical protein